MYVVEESVSVIMLLLDCWHVCSGCSKKDPKYFLGTSTERLKFDSNPKDQVKILISLELQEYSWQYGSCGWYFHSFFDSHHG